MTDIDEAKDVDPVSGFTEPEKRCHDALMESYHEFVKLTREHPDEMREFLDAVHRIQSILATRVIRRVFPDYWVRYEKVGE